jgi:predicted nuclease of restriction endonuclease-like (RecB) superfamily
VIYNRLLRAYVLIDLKIGKLSHQDLGYGKPDVMKSAA